MSPRRGQSGAGTPVGALTLRVRRSASGRSRKLRFSVSPGHAPLRRRTARAGKGRLPHLRNTELRSSCFSKSRGPAISKHPD